MVRAALTGAAGWCSGWEPARATEKSLGGLLQASEGNRVDRVLRPVDDECCYPFRVYVVSFRAQFLGTRAVPDLGCDVR